MPEPLSASLPVLVGGVELESSGSLPPPQDASKSITEVISRAFLIEVYPFTKTEFQGIQIG